MHTARNKDCQFEIDVRLGKLILKRVAIVATNLKGELRLAGSKEYKATLRSLKVNFCAATLDRPREGVLWQFW